MRCCRRPPSCPSAPATGTRPWVSRTGSIPWATPTAVCQGPNDSVRYWLHSRHSSRSDFDCPVCKLTDPHTKLGRIKFQLLRQSLPQDAQTQTNRHHIEDSRPCRRGLAEMRLVPLSNTNSDNTQGVKAQQPSISSGQVRGIGATLHRFSTSRSNKWPARHPQGERIQTRKFLVDQTSLQTVQVVLEARTTGSGRTFSRVRVSKNSLLVFKATAPCTPKERPVEARSATLP